MSFRRLYVQTAERLNGPAAGWSYGQPAVRLYGCTVIRSCIQTPPAAWRSWIVNPRRHPADGPGSRHFGLVTLVTFLSLFGVRPIETA